MYEHFTRQQQQFNVRRGDVYYINNNRGQRGNEIRKDRPAVIVSADFLNKHSGDVVVVFLTSQPKKDMSTHVTIRTTGRVSEALCEQPTTVSVERLNNRIGSVTDREMQQIDIALQIALKLDAGADALNFRRGSRCPKIAFWQSKFPKNGSLSINYCDIFEKIV